MRRRPLPLALAATAALALVACAPQEESTDAGSSSSGGSSATGACTPDELDTLEPGTLTIATDEPAYEPWVVGDDIVVRQVTTLALSFDHRHIDGEMGSRFLADVAGILEDPASALLF